MSSQTAIPDADVIRIVQAYYDAVDSRDIARLADTFLLAPYTTLQFNADDPIVTVEAIKEFSGGFRHVVSGIKHSMIDIWTKPLMGNVVPMDLPPARSSSTATVVSTALPTFTIGEGAAVKRIALPATSIFTIDIPSEKFVSVHNMFDIAKLYAAVER